MQIAKPAVDAAAREIDRRATQPLYAAVLELEPPSAQRDWELRMLRELEAFRSMPKPKRGGKVPRLRDPRPGHRATLHEQPPELAGTLAPSPICSLRPRHRIRLRLPLPPHRAEPNNNVIFAVEIFSRRAHDPALDRWRMIRINPHYARRVVMTPC